MLETPSNRVAARAAAAPPAARRVYAAVTAARVVVAGALDGARQGAYIICALALCCGAEGVAQASVVSV